MAAEVSKARIAAEAVQGGDAVFGTECKTIGQRSQSTACHPRCALYDLVIDLEARMRAQRARFDQERHGQGARLQSQSLTQNRIDCTFAVTVLVRGICPLQYSL
jgi:hypothetical protein